MKRRVIAVLVCIIVAIHVNGQFRISGNVKSEKMEALQGATVYIETLRKGTTTDVDGKFVIPDIEAGTYNLVVSYIGYGTVRKKISLRQNTELGSILLKQLYYAGEEATVSAIRAGENTPMAYFNLSRDEIREKNSGQDVPYIIGSTPSVITTSDAGHGIGYTSMRIRGTDANRINVTINGIPLNDSESHSVFWVDLPELASSAEQIQIQRGVGTSTNGAAAFGATVDMQTTSLNSEPYAEYLLTAGSFNTLRNTVSAGTGLIRDKFSLDMRLSDLHSDGYIDRSWTDLQSYYIAAGWFDETSTIKFITFGGFEELYQAWGGVPSYLLKTDRTYNEMGAYTDTSGQTAFYENQVDHYDQLHYQLHYSKKISNSFSLNGALHYTKGEGYYEQYETDQEYEYYGMVLPVTGSDTIYSTDLVRRKWLDNDFFGAIASLKYRSDKSDLIVGGGWNMYSGLHFGKVIWAENFGINTIGHQWYEGLGVKSDWNIYGKHYYYLNEQLTLFADMQLRGIVHIIEGTDANNRDVTQDHSYLFFNPKAGLNYTPATGQRAFVSYARANREPNRNNYTDAPADRAPVQETLNDVEAGYFATGNSWNAGVTLYYMDYKDQLVLTGEINEVGYPVMTNVESSYRTGAEFEFGINYYDKLRWSGNVTLSKNRINNYINYIDNWDYWNDPETEPYQIEENIGNSVLAYSPSIVASSRVDYLLLENFSFSLISKYVSKQYIDNSANDEYIIDPYMVNDLKASWSVIPSWAGKFTFSILVQNLLDSRYETNGWIYRYYTGGSESFIDGYYPQAGRHVMVSLDIRF